MEIFCGIVRGGPVCVEFWFIGVGGHNHIGAYDKLVLIITVERVDHQKRNVNGHALRRSRSVPKTADNF